MKTKPIPAIVMLVAGFVTCIIAIYTHMELKVFTKTLLLVLIGFYIMGGIIKIILDRNFPQMTDEEEQEEQEDGKPEEGSEEDGTVTETLEEEEEESGEEDQI